MGRLPTELVKNYQAQPKEMTENMRKEVKQIRYLKEEIKGEAHSGAGIKNAKTKTSPGARQPHQGIPKETDPKKNPKYSKGETKPLSSRKPVPGYLAKKKSKNENEIPKEKSPVSRKVTWQGLGSLSYNNNNNIKGKKSDEFDPAQLINLEDEDEEYLEIAKKFEKKKNNSEDDEKIKILAKHDSSPIM